VVADYPSREAGQDRGEGNTALKVRDVPVGRGGCDAKLVRGDPQPYRPAGDPAADRHRPRRIGSFIH